MEPDYAKYEEARLDDQINWYDKKSKHEKKCHYFCRTAQLFLSASIPALTGIVLRYHFVLTIIAVISSIVTFIDGISSVKKYHEKWIQYRTISETLKREKFMYLYSAGIYDSANTDKLKTLVERCESIISSENINWANMNNNKKGKK